MVINRAILDIVFHSTTVCNCIDIYVYSAQLMRIKLHGATGKKCILLGFLNRSFITSQNEGCFVRISMIKRKN